MSLRRRGVAFVVAACVVASFAVVGGGPIVGSPPPAAAVGGLSVGVVGDSLLRQTEAHLRSRLGAAGYPVVGYHAVNALRTDQAVSVAAAMAVSPRPNVMLVGLGANDAGQGRSAAQMRTAVRALLQQVTPHVGCVRWFALKTVPHASWPSSYVAGAHRFNQALEEVTAEFPGAEVVHLDHWAALAGPSHFLGDGLHYAGSGISEVGLLARQAVVGCDPAATTGPFWDVPDSAPFASEVAWLAGAGITTGYANGTYRGQVGSFAPSVTRQAMAAFMRRLTGETATPPASPTFTDVAPTSPFYADIEWMADTGVSTGYADGTFRPNAVVSRQAMAAFMRRLTGETATPPASPTFTDVAPTSPFYADIEWMADTGVSTGYADGTFRPDAVVSRYAMAAFLQRVDERL